MVHCEGFGQEMWNIAVHIISFVFLIKTKKTIFIEVTMTIIGENTPEKMLTVY